MRRFIIIASGFFALSENAEEQYPNQLSNTQDLSTNQNPATSPYVFNQQERVKSQPLRLPKSTFIAQAIAQMAAAFMFVLAAGGILASFIIGLGALICKIVKKAGERSCIHKPENSDYAKAKNAVIQKGREQMQDRSAAIESQSRVYLPACCRKAKKQDDSIQSEVVQCNKEKQKVDGCQVS